MQTGITALLFLLWSVGAAYGEASPNFAGALEACERDEHESRRDSCRLVVATAHMYFVKGDRESFKAWIKKAAQYKTIWFYLKHYSPPNF